MAVAGLGRAFAGALLFSMPLFMTMELWRLGLAVDRHRIALLLLSTVILVVGLARELGGASAQPGWRGCLVDSGVAFLMAALAATVVLSVLGAVSWWRDWRDALSVVTLETLPAAVGASYARSQLGQTSGESQRAGYVHELFLMTAGAVVFAANVAPTEEIVLLAAEAAPWHGLALVAVSLVLMHAFVYWVGFRGQERARHGPLHAFASLTVVGYALALAVAAYLLWTLGRFDQTGWAALVMQSVVLALPASLGAAAARLIL
ncbi:TIGR02587 family membrane protein [Geodermatophilus sp. SYSU D01186]